MLKKLLCAMFVTMLLAGRLMAGECCRLCGSEKSVGNQMAAACTDCEQVTILGLSAPFRNLEPVMQLRSSF
jgi:hypothetical protein